MGAVSFLHRLRSSLNPHQNYHLCVVDGLFEEVQSDAGTDPANPNSGRRASSSSWASFPGAFGLLEFVQSSVGALTGGIGFGAGLALQGMAPLAGRTMPAPRFCG